MNELSLFTGAFGGGLGSRLLGWRTICAVEIDPYCREVVLRRQEEKILEPFPIWDDIRTFDGTVWGGKVDIITAGFPCQPFSLDGKREGARDERNMWPETIRVISEVRPRYCLLENVSGILVHEYFGTILKDLAESGYDCRWDCVPASAVGALHIRDRLWILAHAHGEGRPEHAVDDGVGKDEEKQELRQVSPERSPFIDKGRFEEEVRATEFVRTVNGVAHRMDRVGAIGNGQVPEVVRTAWELLT